MAPRWRNMRRRLSSRGAVAGRAAALLGAGLLACGSDPPPADPTGPASDPNPAIMPPVQFSSPVTGELRKVLFYGAYYDQVPGTPAGDYNCGGKAYDGHRGVDILLRNFQVQDSGVAVVAAAPGTVTTVRDGEFDRSTANGVGGFGNHVALTHAGGLVSIYGHLRRNSIAVSLGQSASTGTVIGLVGSSGNSNWPHLHFEVQWPSAVDPFQGPCNTTVSFWAAQLAYQDTFMVTDAGIVRNRVTFAQLLERPKLDTITTADSALTYWVQFFNVQTTAVRYDVYAPDSSLFQSFPGSVSRTYSMRYLTLRLTVAGALTTPGQWRIDYYQGATRIHTQPFVLVAAPVTAGALRRRPAAADIVMLEQGGESVGR